MNNLKDRMLNEKTWAIVGVTDKKSRFGYKIWRLLLDRGYEVYGINPKLKELDGEKIYSTLGELPTVPRVVNMVVNPVVAKSVLFESKELGIKDIFFQPGSYNNETIELAQSLEFNIVKGCVYASLI